MAKERHKRGKTFTVEESNETEHMKRDGSFMARFMYKIHDLSGRNLTRAFSVSCYAI